MRVVVAAVLLVACSARAAEIGGAALDYAVNCQGCHRADGSGTPPDVPALAGSVAKFLRVPGGREYLVRVPGVSQAGLDDAALAAVVNWMLRQFDAADVPAAFVPYTGDEIGRLRQAPLTDVGRARKALVAAIEGAPPASASR